MSFGCLVCAFKYTLFDKNISTICSLIVELNNAEEPTFALHQVKDPGQHFLEVVTYDLYWVLLNHKGFVQHYYSSAKETYSIYNCSLWYISTKYIIFPLSWLNWSHHFHFKWIVCLLLFCRKHNFRERNKLQTWASTNIVINWQQCLNLIKETMSWGLQCMWSNHEPNHEPHDHQEAVLCLSFISSECISLKMYKKSFLSTSE